MLQRAREERAEREKREKLRNQQERERIEEERRKEASRLATAKMAANRSSLPSPPPPPPSLPTHPVDVSRVDIPYELSLLLQRGKTGPFILPQFDNDEDRILYSAGICLCWALMALAPKYVFQCS